jgi:hypothetical protein
MRIFNLESLIFGFLAMASLGIMMLFVRSINNIGHPVIMGFGGFLFFVSFLFNGFVYTAINVSEGK